MIEVPRVGFRPSLSQSNVCSNALGDWLEGIVLFDQKEVTKSDIVDILIDQQICPGSAQELAHEVADDGWNELRRRKSWGGLPDSFSIAANRLEDDADWADHPIRSFLLLLSLLRIFPDWARENRDSVNQGNLFEEVVESICPALLPGWDVFRAGWSPGDAKDVAAIVDELRGRIHVKGALDLSQWHPPNAKDAGLDIVCYRSFRDPREALPVYFLQCASGKNWRDKLDTPNPDLWQKLMDSAVRPSTGIAAPFVVQDHELRIAALTGQITVFDRLRLLSASVCYGVQLSGKLEKRLVEWMQPRIATLPTAD